MSLEVNILILLHLFTSMKLGTSHSLITHQEAPHICSPSVSLINTERMFHVK